MFILLVVEKALMRLNGKHDVLPRTVCWAGLGWAGSHAPHSLVVVLVVVVAPVCPSTPDPLTS